MSLPKILKPKQNTKLKRFGRNNDGGYLVTQKSIINSKLLEPNEYLNDSFHIKHVFDLNLRQ